MKIGIPGYMSGDHFGVDVQYMDFISEFGTPIVLSPGDFPSYIEGVLLPGGADISTIRNGGTPSFHTGSSNPFLEMFDTAILPKIYSKMPIFGICRGLQTVNVMLGGSLYQHLPYHPYSLTDEDLVHDVVYMGRKVKVNSFHHQGINVLASGLIPEASTIEKMPLVEAVSGSMFFAVQWHPERFYDPISMRKAHELFS